MENFIIIESDNYVRDMCCKIIKKYLYASGNYYDIHEFDKFGVPTANKIQMINGSKVYIIDVNTLGKDGYKIAKWIRDNGDVLSPIILISKSAKSFSMKNIKNLLIYNCITLNDNFISELWDTIIKVHKMVTNYKAYSFAIYDEVHRVLYDDIYYIEKNLNNDSVTIYTKNDSYLSYNSIKNLEQELLVDPRFFKSHRSCILNLHHVTTYLRAENIVVFDNGMKIDLVCRNRKKLFNERLLNDFVEENSNIGSDDSIKQ